MNLNRAIFITGIPTAGKTHLAEKLARATGAFCLETDDLRQKFSRSPLYRPWTDLYREMDEKSYYSGTDYETQWQNLVRQSEALWPPTRDHILAYCEGRIPLRSRLAAAARGYRPSRRLLIAEGVNILPHLAHRDLPFPGFVIVGSSYEDVLRRLAARPRWGRTEELQRMEADAFWYGERPRYMQEAEKYRYRVFRTAEEAYPEILKALQPKD
jgi:predicted ATPase